MLASEELPGLAGGKPSTKIQLKAQPFLFSKTMEGHHGLDPEAALNIMSTQKHISYCSLPLAGLASPGSTLPVLIPTQLWDHRAGGHAHQRCWTMESPPTILHLLKSPFCDCGPLHQP